MKIKVDKPRRNCISLAGDLPATAILFLSPKGISRYYSISGQSNLCRTEERQIEVEE